MPHLYDSEDLERNQLSSEIQRDNNQVVQVTNG